MGSRWEGIPLDIILQEFQYLYEPKDIIAFGGDPYVYEKICKDPNGKLWQSLFRRDFSEIINTRGMTIKNRFFKNIDKFKNLTKYRKLNEAAFYGYEKIFDKIDLSTIPSAMFPIIISCAIRGNNFHFYKYLLTHGVNMSESDAFTAVDYNNLLVFEYVMENIPTISDGAIEYIYEKSMYQGRLPVIKYLLTNYPLLKDNTYCMSLAIKNQYLFIIQYLLEKGIDINKIKNEVQVLESRGNNLYQVHKFLNTYSSLPVTASSEKLKIPKIPKSKNIENRCVGYTKIGKQCNRAASDSSIYCYQHNIKKYQT